MSERVQLVRHNGNKGPSDLLLPSYGAQMQEELLTEARKLRRRGEPRYEAAAALRSMARTNGMPTEVVAGILDRVWGSKTPAATATGSAQRVQLLRPGHTGLRPRNLPVVLSHDIQSLGGRQERQLVRRDACAPLCGGPAPAHVYKTLVLLLAQVLSKGEDKTFEWLDLPATELWRRIGLRYRPSLEAAQQLLLDLRRHIFIVQRHDVFRSVAAVGDAEFDASTRRFRLRLSADLRPFLFGLHGDFSRAHTASVFKLRTPYAILFYLHLRRYVGYTKKREHTVTVQDLLTALQVPSKSEYTRDWWRFESDILRPALREVQEKTELRATYTVERSGRTDRTHGPVTGIVFRVREDAAALAAQRKPLVSPPAPPPPSENEQGGREGSDPGRAR